MKNYVLIHGSYSNGKQNWFPWLEDTLKKNGEEVYNLDYPSSADFFEAANIQNYNNWKKVLDQIRCKLNGDTVFVGHSISCIFFIKYCLEHNINISKAIMVAGFNNYTAPFTDFVENAGLGDVFYQALKTFYVDDITKFKDLCDEIVCIYSDTDYIVSQECLKDFAEKLEAKTIKVKNAGHFCDGEYGTKLPQVLDNIYEHNNFISL